MIQHPFVPKTATIIYNTYKLNNKSDDKLQTRRPTRRPTRQSTRQHKRKTINTNKLADYFSN